MSMKVRVGKFKTKRGSTWVVVVSMLDAHGKRIGSPYFQGRFRTKALATKRKRQVEDELAKRFS